MHNEILFLLELKPVAVFENDGLSNVKLNAYNALHDGQHFITEEERLPEVSKEEQGSAANNRLVFY